jgi:hypothetical protein
MAADWYLMSAAQICIRTKSQNSPITKLLSMPSRGAHFYYTLERGNLGIQRLVDLRNFLIRIRAPVTGLNFLLPGVSRARDLLGCFKGGRGGGLG